MNFGHKGCFILRIHIEKWSEKVYIGVAVEEEFQEEEVGLVEKGKMMKRCEGFF